MPRLVRKKTLNGHLCSKQAKHRWVSSSIISRLYSVAESCPDPRVKSLVLVESSWQYLQQAAELRLSWLFLLLYMAIDEEYDS